MPRALPSVCAPSQTFACRGNFSPRQNSLVWTESARVFAICFVILQHATDSLVLSQPVGSGLWLLTVFVNSTTRWAAPIFIMISGSVMLRSGDIDTLHWYRRRLLRVAVFSFWIAFYAAYSLIIRSWNVALVWQAIKDGTLYYHLWFLYAITGLYVLTPVLRATAGRVSDKTWNLLTLMAFILAAGNAILSRFFGFSIVSGPFLFLPYVGYYMAGRLLATVNKSHIDEPFLWGGVILGVAGSVSGMVFFTNLYGNVYFGRYFHSNLSLPVICSSICVFLLLQKMDLRSPFLSWVSSASFAIYILHPLVLAYLVEFFGETQSIVTGLMMAMATLFLTAPITWLFRRSRILCRLF